MNEIKCPKCGTIFQINESDYESILNHIKNDEYKKDLEELEKRIKLEQEKKSLIQRIFNSTDEEEEKKKLEKVIENRKQIEEQHQLKRDSLANQAEQIFNEAIQKERRLNVSIRYC